MNVITKAILTGFLLTSVGMIAGGLTSVADAGSCFLTVGTCRGSCEVNLGYCDSNGSCTINAGYCNDRCTISVLNCQRPGLTDIL